MAIAMWWVRRRRRDRAGTGSTTDLLASPDLEKGSRGFDTSSIMTNETGESSSMGGHSVMVPYSQLSERPGYSGRPGFQVMRQHRPPAIIVPPNTYAEERPTSPVYGLHDQPPATSRPLPKVPHASPQLLNPHDTYHPDKYVQTPIVELPEIRRSLINGRKLPPNLRPLNLRADLSPMPIPVSAFSNKSAGRASARMSSYQTGQPSPLHNTLAPAMAVVGGFPPELTKSSGIDDGNKRKSWKNVPLSPIVPMSARPPMKSPNPEIRVRSPRSLPNSPTEYDSHRKSRPPSYRSNNSSRQPSGKENAMSPPGIASAVLKSAGSIFSVALTPAAPNSAALKTAPRSAFSPSMAPLREDDEKRASSLTMVLNSMSSNLPGGSPLAKELTIPLPVTPAAAAPVTPLRLRKLQLGSD
ncbi:hypothetical protein C8Q75DRAFT_199044 [Abortiporus biennis]|nr:hypothetical protein C8Q75DRAFT_199044 [Abortiporus biennis]